MEEGGLKININLRVPEIAAAVFVLCVQYEKIINHGLSTIGKRMWLAATIASGKMTAQSTPGICHPRGTRLVVRTIIIASMKKMMRNARQKRRKIRGSSMKKLDRSTSFLVAPHVMLNEKRCARRAWDK